MALMRNVLDQEEHAGIFAALHDEPDRVVAIVGSGLVENALKEAIQSKFVRLPDDERNGLFDDMGNGPLSGFSARIRIGRALGIYGSNTKADLDYFRLIRNVFAHSIRSITFDNEAVRSACNAIQIVERLKSADVQQLDLIVSDEPKHRFWGATVATSLLLQIVSSPLWPFGLTEERRQSVLS